ncbi:MAG TPA: MgtC/SapB family protein [Armatimonadota bacterium]|jgi:putative Mg2+ transporter-C (MgtC) family protein
MDTTLLAQVGRLAAAALLGGCIGFQRERDRHPAGLRTHMLVAVGATLITLASDSYPGSDGRIAAQIVSGIGFLGAGTIIREGPNVKGLTTAASLWAVAGLGIAVGRGGYMMTLACVAAIIILLTLSVFELVERLYIERTGMRVLAASLDAGALPKLFQALIESRAVIFSAAQSQPDSTGAIRASIRMAAPRDVPFDALLGKLMHVEGVRHVRWDLGQEVDSDV